MTKLHFERWIAVVALITAFLGLTTAFVQYEGAQSAKRDAAAASERAETAAQLSMRLEAELKANREKLAQQVAAQQAVIKAESKEKICDDIRIRRQAVDQRFSELQDAHGILLNSVRGCIKGDDKDKGGCLAAVCIGAAFFTDGKSNCVSVSAEAASIAEDSKRERQTSLVNQCEAAASTAETYFD